MQAGKWPRLKDGGACSALLAGTLYENPANVSPLSKRRCEILPHVRRRKKSAPAEKAGCGELKSGTGKAPVSGL